MPSLVSGPLPCARVNLRWKICRPRRIARNGSRLMMKSDVFGVKWSPRPAPISWTSDLLIAPPATVGPICVMSLSCASAVPATIVAASAKAAPIPNLRRFIVDSFVCDPRSTLRTQRQTPDVSRFQVSAGSETSVTDRYCVSGNKRLIFSAIKGGLLAPSDGSRRGAAARVLPPLLTQDSAQASRHSRDRELRRAERLPSAWACRRGRSGLRVVIRKLFGTSNSANPLTSSPLRNCLAGSSGLQPGSQRRLMYLAFRMTPPRRSSSPAAKRTPPCSFASTVK